MTFFRLQLEKHIFCLPKGKNLSCRCQEDKWKFYCKSLLNTRIYSNRQVISLCVYLVFNLSGRFIVALFALLIGILSAVCQKESMSFREVVKYYFADFVRKGRVGGGDTPQIRNPLFAENFVRKGGGVPPMSVTFFWTKNRCFLGKKTQFLALFEDNFLGKCPKRGEGGYPLNP